MNVPESVSGSFCQSYFIHNEKEPKLWATLWLWALSSERGLKSARWSHTCLKFKGCSGQDLKQQPNSTLRVPGTDRKHMAFQNCIYFMEWLELRKGCSLLFAKSAVETNVQSQKFRTSGTWKKDKLFLHFMASTQFKNVSTRVCSVPITIFPAFTKMHRSGQWAVPEVDMSLPNQNFGSVRITRFFVPLPWGQATWDTGCSISLHPEVRTKAYPPSWPIWM